MSDLEGASADEARKVVSVLFCDLVGFTSRGDALDPEALRRLQQRYFDTARTTLERRGATVEKFIGDAVMAVFGLPRVHEDDALRAVRAAAELRDAVHALGLEARIGVNSGQVVAGAGEALVTGDAVNLAARLQQEASPGEILIGTQTRRLCPAAVRVEPVGPLELRGKSEPVPAFRLLDVLDTARAFARRLDAPFVGRRHELAHLRASLERATAERSCRIVTVVGSPGIGKSRFVQEFVTSLPDTAVLSGACLPHGEGATYRPLAEAALASGDDEDLAAALRAGAPEEVAWSVRKSLERSAREQPVVLVLDDIQWADPPLLELIEHLVDWTRDASLLLLCLARPELLEQRPDWIGGRPAAELLTLAPLSDHEAHTLIEALLGDAAVAEGDRERIEQVSGGNPLFAEQLVAAAADGRDVEAVPPTIQALLSARLDALPPDQRELLERASVFGLEFAWQALGDLDPDGRAPSGARLFSLVRQELIRPHETDEDTFRFRHLLIRDAAYERMPKARRADLHERLADSLERSGHPPERDELIGYHLEQAYRYRSEVGGLDAGASELAGRGASHLGRAGERALRRNDVRAAASLLGRAIALLPEASADRLRLLPELGSALAETGRLEEAEAVLGEAVDAALRAGDRATAGRAAVEQMFLRLLTGSPDWTDDGEATVGAFRHLFEELGDDQALARLWRLSGVVAVMRGRLAEQLTAMERALEHASRAGDSREESLALFWIPDAVAWGPTPAEDGVRRCEALLLEHEGRPSCEAGVKHALGMLYAMQGRAEDARAASAACRELYRELGLDVLWCTAAIGTASAELGLDDPAAAERQLTEAMAVLERLGERGYRSTAAAFLAQALNEQGRDDEAIAATRLSEELASPDDMPSQMGWRSQRARALARRGEHLEAERLARAAVELAASTDSLQDKGETAFALAEVLLAAGRRAEAAEAAEAALLAWERKGVVGRVGKARGFLAKLRTR